MNTKLVKVTVDGDEMFFGGRATDMDVVVDCFSVVQDGRVTNVASFAAGRVPLNALPAGVVDDVLGTLRVYDRCYVTYAYNRFRAAACCGVKSSYAQDEVFCGEYLAKDVYTPEQRLEHMAALADVEW